MRYRLWGAVWLTAIVGTTPASAQVRAYVAADAGVERRHSLMRAESRYATAPAQQRVRHGLAYAVAAGVELRPAARLYTAVEVDVSHSTVGTTVLRNRTMQRPSGLVVAYADEVRVRPRWGAGATARFGLRPTPAAVLYVLAGVAGERARVSVGPPTTPGSYVSPDVSHRTNAGFVYGGGARLALAGQLGLRIEYRRIDTGAGYRPQRLTGGATFDF